MGNWSTQQPSPPMVEVHQTGAPVNSLRSARCLFRKMRYWSLIFLVGALLTCIGCGRMTPAQTFQTATRKPMPSSVRILHSRTRAVTAVDHYVHFTISPEDLAAIVQAGSYKRDASP